MDGKHTLSAARPGGSALEENTGDEKAESLVEIGKCVEAGNLAKEHLEIGDGRTSEEDF